MGFLLGAVTGLGVNLWSRGLRQLPLTSAPWEHVLALGAGGLVGYKYDFWMEDLKQGLQEDLERHGRKADVYNTKYA